MHIDLAVAPGCSSHLQTKLVCAAQPDGAEIGSVAQVIVASVGEQSGSPVTARGGRESWTIESGHRVGPDDCARYVVGVVLEAVERYRADVALAVRPVVGPRSGPGRARNKKCLVGRTGFEPVTSSVSGKFARILTWFLTSPSLDLAAGMWLGLSGRGWASLAVGPRMAPISG
jgi:hypothetical protein